MKYVSLCLWVKKMNYTKPFIAEYGNTNEVTKGDCGWGIENLTLDKTGSVSRLVFTDFFDIKRTCSGDGVICTDTYIRGCMYLNKCNGKDDCSYL